MRSSPPCVRVGIILEMNLDGNGRKGPESQKLMHKILYPRDDIDRLYVSRNAEGRTLPALKIAWIHQYVDAKTTLKRANKDLLRHPVIALTTER